MLYAWFCWKQDGHHFTTLNTYIMILTPMAAMLDGRTDLGTLLFSAVTVPTGVQDRQTDLGPLLFSAVTVPTGM